MAIVLERPNVAYKQSFLEALEEFQREGLPWHMDRDPKTLQQNFGPFVQSELNKSIPVPATEFWAIENGVFVGRIAIRHTLTEDLRNVGGHIGYDTRPSYRGRGIGSKMLELALPHAKILGLKEVLITCNDSNFASIKIIEKCGGVLKETRPPFPGSPVKRYYWITL